MAARRFVLAAAAVVLSASAACAETFPRRVPTSSAKTVGSFLDSVGVNTHWNYSDTPYGYAYPQVSQLLLASGIRHMRAGCDDDAVLDLWRRGRMRSTVSFEPDYGSISAQTDCVKRTNARAGGQAIVAIEGPNEPDLFWAPRRTKTYRGQGFPDGAKNFLCDVHTAVNADPATANLPVLGMSFGVTYGSAPAPFSSGELARCVDWGNAHPYPGNGEPFSSRTGYGGLGWYFGEGTNPGINLAEQRFLFGKIEAQYSPKPMAVTETGYSTYDDGTPNQALHAIYMPRLFAEYFRLGVKRTFSYEFIDEFVDPDNDDREAHFGLVNRDLTPKPAYTALKALLRRLRATEDDRRVGSNVGEVRVTVDPPAGYGRTEYVRSLLLERADGGFALLLWHEISGENKDTKQRLRHPAIPVTVGFDVPAASAKRYAYDEDWALVRTDAYAGTPSVDLTVDEKLSILFFR